MKAEFKLFTLKGIGLFLHYTLLVFVIWLAVIFVAGGLHLNQLLWSVLLLVAFFLSFVVHEYGHAQVASLFGINAKRIIIYPIGAIPSLEKLPENPWQELLISAAGPLISFCVGAGLLLFAPQPVTLAAFTHYNGSLNATNFVQVIGMANVALAVLNIIPAFPLDGGRILRALLAYKYNYLKATTIVQSISQFVAFLLLVTAVFSMNLVLALLGIFIFVFSKAEEAYLQISTLVKGIQLREVLMYDYDSIEAHLSVTEAASVLENNHTKYFIVLEEGIPVGTLNRMEVVKALAEQKYDAKISDLMKSNLVRLTGDMWVEDVLDTLSAKERKLYPVFEQETFLGVVNFQHIIEYLLIHKAVSKDYSKTKSLAELV